MLEYLMIYTLIAIIMTAAFVIYGYSTTYAQEFTRPWWSICLRSFLSVGLFWPLFLVLMFMAWLLNRL